MDNLWYYFVLKEIIMTSEWNITSNTAILLIDNVPVMSKSGFKDYIEALYWALDNGDDIEKKFIKQKGNNYD